MEEFDRFILYLAILSGIVILVAYNVGAKNVIGAIGSNLQKLFLIGQGRVPSTGQFANYPGGAPTPAGS